MNARTRKMLSSQQGYTLIELLVATLLAPLLMMTIGSGYVYMQAQYSTAMRRAELLRQGTFAVEIISKQVREAYGFHITIKEIVNAESWTGRQLVVGLEESDNWSWFYHDPDSDTLYHEITIDGNSRRFVVASEVSDVLFSYDNPENPGAVTIYLCYDGLIDTGDGSECFTAKAKWRNWATWEET